MAEESGTDARSAGMTPIGYEADEVREPASPNSDDQRAHARAQCSARHTRPDLDRCRPAGRELITRHILLLTDVNDSLAGGRPPGGKELLGGNHESEKGSARTTDRVVE